MWLLQVSEDPNFQIVTARCSEVNVTVLPPAGKEEEQDPDEHPIPEQFVSSFKKGKLITTAAAHSGA